MWSQAAAPGSRTSHPRISQVLADHPPVAASRATGPRSGRSRAANRAIRAAALLCLAVTAGCASAATSSSTPAAPSSTSAPASSSPATPAASTPAATPTSAAAVPACATSALLVRLGVAEGYAGGVDYVIDFTNQSGAACTMYGYPGVSLVSGPPYKQIGLAAQRANNMPVKLVTMIPGAVATAELRIADAHNFTPQICRPVATTHLRVYPPNQTAPVYLTTASFGCAEHVQTLFISAVQASGKAHPMTTSTAGQ